MANADPVAERQAARRVEATLEAARRVDLSRLLVGAPGPDVIDARRRARDAATEAGRIELLDEARQTATDWVLQAFSRGAYSGTWAMTDMAMSVTRPADRVAVAEALADSVSADVVEDLVDDITVGSLRTSWRSLDSSAALPDTGSIANLTSTLVSWSERRRAWVGIVVAVVLSVIGLGQLAFGQAFGIVFLAVGAVALRNALRQRSV